MPRLLLDVGNCAMDHGSITELVERNFDAQIYWAHSPDDALKLLAERPFDLVIVNRKMDRDGSDGLELIQQIKASPKSAALPVMLISNYDEYQQAAIAVGAEPGFGKAQLQSPQTREILAKYLA